MSKEMINIYIENIVEEKKPLIERKKHRFDLMRKIVNATRNEEQPSPPPINNYNQQVNDHYDPYGYSVNSYYDPYGYPAPNIYQPPTFEPNPYNNNNIIDIINNVSNTFEQEQSAPIKRGRGRPRKNPNNMNGSAPEKKADAPNPKDSENFYEVRFDDTLEALSDLCSEVDDFIDETKLHLYDLKKSKTASHVAVTNQTSNVTSLFSTKLNVLKEVNSTKKMVSDLEIKKNSKKESVAESQENEAKVLDKLFTKVSSLNSGPIPTSLMLNNINQSQVFQPQMPMNPNNFNNNINDNSNNNIPPYEAFIDSQINNRIGELERSGDIQYHQSDIATRYENNEPELIVIRDGNNIRIEARDNTGRLIPGYPTPTLEQVGKIKFTSDGVATDQYGRKYEIIDI